MRAPNGIPTVTDGLFAESKEQLAGVFIVECATPERVMQIAERFPDTRFGAVEVRPVMGEIAEDAGLRTTRSCCCSSAATPRSPRRRRWRSPCAPSAG